MNGHDRKSPARDSVRDTLIESLSTAAFAHVSAESMQLALGADDESLSRFSAEWTQLAPDRHMGDGGTYRYRRYAELELSEPASKPTRLPHAPYRQSVAVNPLNGGIDRHFEPVSDTMFDEPLLQDFLGLIAESLDAVEGTALPWRIRLHPYRVVATESAVGKPSPEGPHRDGVCYVMSWMIGRQHVSGGTSEVFDLDRGLLWQRAMSEPLELSIVDDRRVLHDVSAISAESGSVEGSRDVFVIAFDRPPSPA